MAFVSPPTDESNLREPLALNHLYQNKASNNKKIRKRFVGETTSCVEWNLQQLLLTFRPRNRSTDIHRA